MRVYTLQPVNVLHTIQRGELYRPDPNLCRAEGFVGDDQSLWRAYRWIAGRLALQHPPPVPEALPVWVWATFNHRSPKPDLRRHHPVTPGVLLELEVDDDRVLLSDFDGWHTALNGWFLGSETEVTAFESQCDQKGYGPAGFWQDEDMRQQVTGSWLKCLDLDWYDPFWHGADTETRKTQGVLWELRPEDVKASRIYRGWPSGK
ncbi:DUF3841 domain-containing protein [Deinococcus antarcticus]|uniref:DUF3841 domain-containing protein n=1 Tax=Deinococcus antarcticus TaxID=1298767 RepID=A0ABV8AEC9_9DEIO